MICEVCSSYDRVEFSDVVGVDFHVKKSVKSLDGERGIEEEQNFQKIHLETPELNTISHHKHN